MLLTLRVEPGIQKLCSALWFVFWADLFSLGVSVHCSQWLWIMLVFVSPFQSVQRSFFFSCLTVLVRTSSTMLNTNAHPCIVPDCKVTVPGMSLRSVTFAICVLINRLDPKIFITHSKHTHTHTHTHTHPLDSVTSTHIPVCCCCCC